MTTEIDTLRGDLATELERHGGYCLHHWAERVRKRGDDPEVIRRLIADLAQFPAKKIRPVLTAACRLWIAMQEKT